MADNGFQSQVVRSSVCARCRGRKKKCDKAFPSCGRCSRLNVRCAYSAASGETVQHAATTAVQPDESKNPSNYLQQDRGKGSPTFLPEITSRNTFIAGIPHHQSILHDLHTVDLQPLDFEKHFVQQAHDIAARNGDNFQNAALNYFLFDHPWYPIISRTQMIEGLLVMQSELRAEFADMLLCVYLMTQLSSRASVCGEELQQLYHTVKGMHYVLLSTGRSSIEVVQAGLLIALFEYTQGLHESAYSSIGACARMGHLLNFHKSLSPVSVSSPRSAVVVESERKLWWGIIILERFITLEHIDDLFPFASQTPDLNDLLPLEGNQSNLPVAHGLDLPDPYAVPQTSEGELSKFAQISQACYLLSLVIDYMRRSETTECATVHLDLSIRTLASKVIQPATAGAHNCWAHSILLVALLTLHRHELSMQPVQIDPCLSPAALAIQSIIRMVLDGSTYRTYDSQDDLDTLPCWILKSAYLAALEHIQLGDKSDINLWTKQLSGLKSSLTIFSRRWKLAAYFLEKIEKAEIVKTSNLAI